VPPQEGRSWSKAGAEVRNVTLHDAILARRAVDGDVGIIEPNGFVVQLEGEIALVDFYGISVEQIDVPIEAFYVHYIDVVTLFVEEGIKSLCRSE